MTVGIEKRIEVGGMKPHAVGAVERHIEGPQMSEPTSLVGYDGYGWPRGRSADYFSVIQVTKKTL